MILRLFPTIHQSVSKNLFIISKPLTYATFVIGKTHIKIVQKKVAKKKHMSIVLRKHIQFYLRKVNKNQNVGTIK